MITVSSILSGEHSFDEIESDVYGDTLNYIKTLATAMKMSTAKEHRNAAASAMAHHIVLMKDLSDEDQTKLMQLALNWVVSE